MEGVEMQKGTKDIIRLVTKLRRGYACVCMCVCTCVYNAINAKWQKESRI